MGFTDVLTLKDNLIDFRNNSLAKIGVESTPNSKMRKDAQACS